MKKIDFYNEVETIRELEILSNLGAKNFLISYIYLGDPSKAIDKLQKLREERKLKLMLDSGAYTLFSKKDLPASKILNSYLEYIKRDDVQELFDYIIMLDSTRPKINYHRWKLFQPYAYFVDHIETRKNKIDDNLLKIYEDEDKVCFSFIRARKLLDNYLKHIKDTDDLAHNKGTDLHALGCVSLKTIKESKKITSCDGAITTRYGEVYCLKREGNKYIIEKHPYSSPSQEIKNKIQKIRDKFNVGYVSAAQYLSKWSYAKLFEIVNERGFKVLKESEDDIPDIELELEEELDIKEGLILPDISDFSIYYFKEAINPINITFLGTRGEIEEKNRYINKHSSIIIDYNQKRYLFDFGANHKGSFNEINPDVIFITHSHPDHSGGLPENIGKPTILSKITYNQLSKFIRFEEPITDEKGEIEDIEYEMVEVEHSKLAPAIGFILKIGNQKIGYFPDFLKIKNEDKLENLDLLIAGASSIFRDIVRQFNIGHISVKNVLLLAKKYNIKKVLFTHYGKEIIDNFSSLNEIKKELINETGYENFEFMFDNDKVVVKDEEIKIKKEKEATKENNKNNRKEITYIPHFVCLVGSRAKGEADENSDWDILIRKETRDTSLELLIQRYLGYDKKLHFIYYPYGPHDTYIPLFDLKLIPKEPQTILIEAFQFEPFKLFIPPKMGSAYTFEEFYKIEDLYEQWAKYYFEEGAKIYVEMKVNGWRSIIHKKGNEAKMFFEGTTKDRLERFKKLKEELLKIKDDFIIDCELVGIREDGSIIPRKDLAIFNSNEDIDCDEFLTSEGEKGKVLLYIFDIPYFNKDISMYPLSERKKYLKEFEALKYIEIIPSYLTSNKNDFIRRVREVSELQGSEGAVLKVSSSIYTPEEIPDWAKFKKIIEFKVKVIDIEKTKDGRAYNYIVSYLNDGRELELCKTMNTKIEAKIGDILTLTCQEVQLFKDDEGFKISIQIPIVQDLDLSRKEPDKIEDIVYRAYKFGLLHTTKEVQDEFFDKYKLKEGWITYKGRRILIDDIDYNEAKTTRMEYSGEKFKFIEAKGGGFQHALRHSCWKGADDMMNSIKETIKKGILFKGKDTTGRTRILFYNENDKTLVIAGEKGIFNAYRVSVPDANKYIFQLTSNFKASKGAKIQ